MKCFLPLPDLIKGIACLILAFNTVSCAGTPSADGDLEKVFGKVVRIIDGDTYDLLTAGKKIIRVRMEGIDAPERGMPYYKVSKQYLADLCFGKEVMIDISGHDRHGRALGYTYLQDGSEASHAMIKAGLAWHFKKYNSDSTLSSLEAQARTARRGLWKENNPVAPWINRKLHRQGISTKGTYRKQTERQPK